MKQYFKILYLSKFILFIHTFIYLNNVLFHFQNQIQEFKAAQTPSTNQLRSMLLDPAINLVFQHMAKEMEECKERQKQTQNELSAWKFTADRCDISHLNRVTFLT